MITNAPTLTEWSQRYAFTITLRPSARLLATTDQYNRYAHDIMSELKNKLIGTTYLSMVCELTSSFDIHFHGIISFDRAVVGPYTNVPAMFRNLYRRHKNVGFVLLKVIDDDHGWNEYLNKSRVTFEQTTFKQPVLIDDFNVFNLDTQFYEGFNEND